MENQPRHNPHIIHPGYAARGQIEIAFEHSLIQRAPVQWHRFDPNADAFKQLLNDQGAFQAPFRRTVDLLH